MKINKSSGRFQILFIYYLNRDIQEMFEELLMNVAIGFC